MTLCQMMKEIWKQMKKTKRGKVEVVRQKSVAHRPPPPVEVESYLPRSISGSLPILT